MSDYKAIVRRQSAPLAPRTLVPEEVSYSVSNDAVMVGRTVWTALRRQWRLALAIFTIIVLAVTAGTLLRPVNYRATGTARDSSGERRGDAGLDALWSAADGGRQPRHADRHPPERHLGRARGR